MQTVIAAFKDQTQAEQARERLVQRGFDRDDVHIEQQGASMAQTDVKDQEQQGSGGIAGFFERLFGSDEDEYQRHGSTWNEAVRRGSAVVIVDVRDEQQADEAATCLHEAGALDIDEHANQWRSEGWAGGTHAQAPQGATQPQRATPPRATGAQPGTTKEGVLNVVQEELQVGKRTLDRGGVRVVQRVSEKPVREVVHLREERAVVDRRPVNRPADASDLTTFKEGTLEIRESTEEAVVAKNARVVEEVRVGKEVKERDEVIEDKLRRKDVDVERIQGQGQRDKAVAADRLPNQDAGRAPGAGGTPLTGTPRKDNKPI